MTQKRNHIAIWAVIFAAVVLLAVSYYYGAIRGTSDSPSVYSVILYQNTDNEWTTLLEGIRQAEEDFGLKVNYVNMSTGDTAQEQAELIRREIDSGVSGILFAAVDSKALGDALKDDNIQIPLVALETGISGISSSNYFSITGDDYGMGQALGQKILKDMEEQGSQRVVTVIREYMERDSVSQRYEGLVDQLSRRWRSRIFPGRKGISACDCILEPISRNVDSILRLWIKFLQKKLQLHGREKLLPGNRKEKLSAFTESGILCRRLQIWIMGCCRGLYTRMSLTWGMREYRHWWIKKKRVILRSRSI